MKILMLLSESWNDITAPNNNMTNWFQDFPDVEIWTISGSSQLPNNHCCEQYFLIGENQMLRSMFSKEKAGARYIASRENNDTINLPETEVDISNNLRIKRIFAGEGARLARDIVWRYGKYNLEEMRKFINSFSPDIVFSQRRGSVKMCRLEATVATMTDAPIVAYTGDDEYSLQQFSLSPVFWGRRLWTRAWLKQTIPTYKLFYSQSERQMQEFKEAFGVETKFLVKCGEFNRDKIHQTVNPVIQLVYAGKLYCNRWKTLAMIARAIRNTNHRYGNIRIQLNIYTGDSVSSRQNKCLNDGENSIIHGRVSASQLPGIFDAADIVLHVESFDLKNRLLTQDSFSTKVMDCLSSGCAVMAVCWEGHAAYQYLKRNKAAIVASNENEIQECIERIAAQPGIVLQYALNAYQCGEKNHQRSRVQRMIYEDFSKAVNRC